MIKRPLFLALALVSTMSLSQAAVKNAEMQSSITIIAACEVIAKDLKFPDTAIVGPNITENTTITVNCTKDATYTVGIDGGSVSGSTEDRRLMIGSGSNTETVAFNLYQDPAHSLPWGSSSLNWQSGTGSGTDQVLNVYGLILSEEKAGTPIPDTYRTTMRVTLNY